MNKNNRRNLFILSFTLLVVMLGYGMVMQDESSNIPYLDVSSFSNRLLFGGKQGKDLLRLHHPAIGF
jgi:hypothetical protein